VQKTIYLTNSSANGAKGASFVITKKGLNASMEKHGFDGDGFGYLRNPTWWAGITTSERILDIIGIQHS
jgi:hypothetical protein